MRVDVRSVSGLFVGGPGRRVRDRRRLDVIVLGVLVLLVAGVAAVGAFAGDSERVTGLWSGAVVDSEGNARVTEVIDYDFGSNRRHGIFREVPGLAADAPVNASSPTAPDGVELGTGSSGTRIRVRDPARTITGRHRYTIDYPLDGVASDGQLKWDAIGTGWLVDIGNIQLHVVAPFEFDGASCIATGDAEPCSLAQPEPGHLVATIPVLHAGDDLTLSASAGRSLGDAPSLPVSPSGAISDPGTGPVLPGLLAAVAALVAAVLITRLVRRAGRERVPAGRVPDPGSAGTAGEVRIDVEKMGSLASVARTHPPELATPRRL